MNNSRDITIFELKNIGKSIWFLLFTICTSVLCVFSYVLFFSSLYGGLYINYLAAVVFYTIQAIGLWLIYAQSFGKNNVFGTTGITMFKVIENIKYVIMIIIACLILFLGILIVIILQIDPDAYISADISDILEYISYTVPGLDTVYAIGLTSSISSISAYAFMMTFAIAFIIAGGIVLAIALIYYPKLLKTLISMRSSARMGVPFTYTSKAVFVMLIIYAVFTAIYGFSSLSQIATTFSYSAYFVSPKVIMSVVSTFIVVAQVIFALFILRHYKGAMDNVDAYLTQNNLYPNGINPNNTFGYNRGYQGAYNNPYVNNYNNQFNGYNQPNQGFNPNQAQNFNQGFNPNQQQNFNQGFNPNQAQNFNQGFNPNQSQAGDAPQANNEQANSEQANGADTNNDSQQ